jgi:hypothetical protein
MERIEPIRRPDGSLWVAPAAPGRRVERREPGEEGDRRRRRQPPQTPDGHPDADGHIDVEA